MKKNKVKVLEKLSIHFGALFAALLFFTLTDLDYEAVLRALSSPYLYLKIVISLLFGYALTYPILKKTLKKMDDENS